LGAMNVVSSWQDVQFATVTAVFQPDPDSLSL
jgi:hypothetical protein